MQWSCRTSKELGQECGIKLSLWIHSLHALTSVVSLMLMAASLKDEPCSALLYAYHTTINDHFLIGELSNVMIIILGCSTSVYCNNGRVVLTQLKASQLQLLMNNYRPHISRVDPELAQFSFLVSSIVVQQFWKQCIHIYTVSNGVWQGVSCHPSNLPFTRMTC